jgi:hypothetical protein
MPTNTSTGIEAHDLRALLEKKHGEPAMHWRDQFALGCWLYHTGHDKAGRKVVREVLSTVRAKSNHKYLDTVENEAAINPVQLAQSVWPHVEILELFESISQ